MPTPTAKHKMPLVLPAALHERLRREAYERNTSKTAVIIAALEAWLPKEK